MRQEAVLKKGLSTAVGDEGGIRSKLESVEDAIDAIRRREGRRLQARQGTSSSRSMSPAASSTRTGNGPTPSRRAPDASSPATSWWTSMCEALP